MSSLASYLDPAVIQQVSRLDLRARFIVEGFLAGLHSSPFGGFSVEFAEHRKYVQGDEPRLIDWRVFARTDRLFIRRYAAETHLACHLLVDTSASMGFVGYLGSGPVEVRDGQEVREPWPQPAGKLLYAIHIAAALGYLVTKQQDAVGLGLIGEGLEKLLPARSRRRHLVDLLSALAGVVPHGKTGLARGISEALGGIPHRGLVVLLSDLLTDTDAVLEALHHVRYRGHDLIVMHILDAAEAQFPFEGRVRLEDPETGDTLVATAASVRESYLAAVERWRVELRERISAARADYVPLDTATPFDKALIEFLVQRRRRR
ncbi:MAG: DUF58 domain-containing protein [Planctomycetota bacterium]